MKAWATCRNSDMANLGLVGDGRIARIVWFKYSKYTKVCVLKPKLLALGPEP